MADKSGTAGQGIDGTYFLTAAEEKKTREYYEKVFEGQDPESRFRTTGDDLQDFLEQYGLLEHASVSGLNLGQSILSYYEDVYRLKNYEDIERVNRPKIYAYMAYWLLRHHVIEVEHSVRDPRYAHINERIIANWLVGHILMYKGVPVDRCGEAEEDFYRLLFYNFKYRTFTQQSLELMISAFCAGLECGEEKGKAAV